MGAGQDWFSAGASFPRVSLTPLSPFCSMCPCAERPRGVGPTVCPCLPAPTPQAPPDRGDVGLGIPRPGLLGPLDARSSITRHPAAGARAGAAASCPVLGCETPAGGRVGSPWLWRLPPGVRHVAPPRCPPSASLSACLPSLQPGTGLGALCAFSHLTPTTSLCSHQTGGTDQTGPCQPSGSSVGSEAATAHLSFHFRHENGAKLLCPAPPASCPGPAAFRPRAADPRLPGF